MNTVYIELVFIDNLMLNFLCLMFASVLTKSPKKILRFLGGGAIGSVYACLAFSLNSFVVSLLMKIAIGLIMCLAAFAGSRGFFKNTAAFFMTSFVFAGCMYALRESFITEYGTFSASARAVAVGVCVASVLIIVISRVRKKALDRHSLTYDMELIYKDRGVSVKAYYDTGNMLIEPLSGCGVIFVEKTVADMLFSEDELELLDGTGDLQSERLRFLPCSTAAGQSMFLGIEIDKASAFGRHTKAVVCIAKGDIADGAQAIVGNKIMDELKGGAQDDKKVDTQNSSSNYTETEGRLRRRLHKRQRSASTAAVQEGRRDSA